MTTLNSEALKTLPTSIILPKFEPKSLPISVVHFGPGAFHRAHQAAYFDAINAFDPRWGICCVSLHSSTVRDALSSQDGLYTLAILDQTISYQIIGSIRELLVAPESIEKVVARLADPAVKIVTSTVTEKGYCLRADGTLDLSHEDISKDLKAPNKPCSFIGFVALGLAQRFRNAQAAFTIIACDNIQHNGQRLKAALVTFTAQFDLALSAWIQQNLQAPCTMVDSITPATDDGLRDRIFASTGIRDAWPIQREAFSQWVIETHDMVDAPDWRRAGVTLTSDVSIFERAKLRLLNGPHSALAYLGSLAGYQSVFDAMQDASLVRFIEQFMKCDVAPLLTERNKNELDLPLYCDDILQRFRNPGIKHLLAQIACDGSQKIPIRILAPMLEALEIGADVSRFAVPVAAWLRFIRQKFIAGETILDPLSNELSAMAANFTDNISDIDLALSMHTIFSIEFTESPAAIKGFKEAYKRFLPQSDKDEICRI